MGVAGAAGGRGAASGSPEVRAGLLVEIADVPGDADEGSLESVEVSG